MREKRIGFVLEAVKGLLSGVKNHHSRQKQKREALKTGKGCLEILCCLDQKVNREIPISSL